MQWSEMVRDFVEGEYEGERDFHFNTYRRKEPEPEPEPETEIRPSLHEHSLGFSNKFDSAGDCAVCKQQITGPHYYCTSTSSCPKFFIHNQPCFEMEDQIQHHSFHPHPHHTLSLSPTKGMSRTYFCDVCRYRFDKHDDYAYRCDECDFCIDVKCASLSLTNCSTGHDHPHPLMLCHKNKYFSYECNFCLLPYELEGSSMYVCLQCLGLLHKSCADLPIKMEHPEHPEHPLILDGPDRFTCTVCREQMVGFSYSCQDCCFNMDVHCALLKDMKSNKGYKLYADFPQKIQHLLHPQHTLTLCYDVKSILSDDVSLSCEACFRYAKGFYFECNQCEWYLHVGCALAKYTPMMSRRIHQHPLVFFNKSNNLFDCNSCGRCCYTPFFRCFRCDFNLHVHCLPLLPPTIKYNNHIHPLTLTNYPIKGYAGEDDNAEFYCDACEELRALPDKSYYCKECSYVAHPHCMVSEIISILEEEWSELQSDASGNKVEVLHVPDEECSKSHEIEEPPLLTLKEFLYAIRFHEETMFRLPGWYMDTYSSKSGIPRLDMIMDLTNKNYDLIDKIKVPWENWDPTSKVVTVGVYMILEDLAPILDALFAKYGDFGCNCKLASKSKMLCVMVVCDAIRSMCNTAVKDITEHLLLSWFHSLMLGLKANFKIGFALDRLTRVARAHFGNKANVPAYNLNFNADIRKLKEKLQMKQALLDLGKDCHLDALRLKGQTAGMGLL